MVVSAPLLALLMLFIMAPPLQAAATKFPNRAHSLTGDCSVLGWDNVPDPGCPGGDHPPQGGFGQSAGVATGSHGEIYVVNRNQSKGQYQYHIDIFDANGFYIRSIFHPRAQMVAVDSTGHLYVFADDDGTQLMRYDPITYDPDAGEIEYAAQPVVIPQWLGEYGSITVDMSNDHLYVAPGAGGPGIAEYAAAVDGTPNALVTNEIARQGNADDVKFMGGMAIDAARDRIYVVDATSLVGESKVGVFSSQPPYQRLATIDNGATANGNFSGPKVQLAVDEESGHLFVGDLAERRRVYEFDADGTYLGALERPPTIEVDFAWMALDNSEISPNRGYLYVPSGLAATGGHLYAYEPEVLAQPPEVESIAATAVMQNEAVLRATVNPKGTPSHWVLEYVSLQSFEEEGETFVNPSVAGEGDLPPSNEGIEVSGPATGLQPGTSYRFRVRIESECQPGGCFAEKQGQLTTFLPARQVGTCSNQPLRTGPSGRLPDCRAYELVTPANTGGLRPIAPVYSSSGSQFATPPGSPSGNSFAFRIEGGTIPGTDGAGGNWTGDTYRSTRSAVGWQTEAISPDGSQAGRSMSGGLSAEHGYLAVLPFSRGSLLIGEKAAVYVRYPDGSFRLAGEGSLGTDLLANVQYITPDGSHIFISTGGTTPEKVQLEPNAPPDGTGALYDRTADGILHVVSLLPGEVTPPAGVDAEFKGASEDGSSVAFTIGPAGPLYVRVDNSETLQAAPGGAIFAGLSDDGRYLFYLSGGDLHRFDSEAQSSESITDTGDITPVNVGSRGSAAYFLSPSVLGEGINPLGAEPQPGAYNLYRWDGTGTRFLATVTERDAKGANLQNEGATDGLGLWVNAVRGAPKILSSRTTPDGTVLLFQSRANLTGFDSAGKSEIYRYDAAVPRLHCLSCDPTGAPPSSDAALLASALLMGGKDAVGINTQIPNLSPDGRRAFFESAERLVHTDNDGVTDVYEWEAEGKGSCAEPGGCLFLISSGQSARPNHLLGVSESGDDVFILTSDLLVAEDTDETPSVYDARVGGGFPPAPARAVECLGEACQPAASPPVDVSPAIFETAGNVSEKRPAARCPKGKRKIRQSGKSGRQSGKSRCVRAHKKKSRGKKRSRTERKGAHR